MRRLLTASSRTLRSAVKPDTEDCGRRGEFGGLEVLPQLVADKRTKATEDENRHGAVAGDRRLDGEGVGRERQGFRGGGVGRRGIVLGKAVDHLGDAILSKGKVRRLQSGGGMVVPVADDNVQDDEASGDVDGGEGFGGIGGLACGDGGRGFGRLGKQVRGGERQKREQQGKASVRHGSSVARNFCCGE
jgi:hypothetical protein